MSARVLQNKELAIKIFIIISTSYSSCAPMQVTCCFVQSLLDYSLSESWIWLCNQSTKLLKVLSSVNDI